MADTSPNGRVWPSSVIEDYASHKEGMYHDREVKKNNGANRHTPDLDYGSKVQGHGNRPPRARGEVSKGVATNVLSGALPVAIPDDGLGKRGLDRRALPSHKILTHWTRLLAWCNEEVLREHSRIPRQALKGISWRLAERLVEEHGDRLVGWIEGKG